MTFRRLILRSAAYYWRTNFAVVMGVAAAVSVLAGALLVGDSVRGSLRDIAIGRLGKADHVVSSAGFFREALADDLRKALPGAAVTPLVVATGFVTHEMSGRRAAGVLVYGVDERFWAFHGQPEPGGPDEIRPRPHRGGADGVVMSPALARELGITAGDTLLVRLQKPSEIPIESLFGRKDEDEIGRTVSSPRPVSCRASVSASSHCGRSRRRCAPCSRRSDGFSATSPSAARSTRCSWPERRTAAWTQPSALP